MPERLTPSEIERLREDKKPTFAKLRELREQREKSPDWAQQSFQRSTEQLNKCSADYAKKHPPKS